MLFMALVMLGSLLLVTGSLFEVLKEASGFKSGSLPAKNKSESLKVEIF